MVKKFKCNNCGHVFQAEETEIRYCPKCLSQNIGPYKLKLLPIFVVAIGVISIIVGVLCLYNGKGNLPLGGSDGTDSIDDTTGVDTVVVVDPAISLLENKPIKKGKTYEYQVATKPSIKSSEYRYSLYEDQQHTRCVADNDGDNTFKSVGPSETGIYYLVIEEKKTKKIIISEPVSGFNLIDDNTPVPSADEIQRMLNSQDERLSSFNNVKLIISGVSDKSLWPSSLAELADRIMMDGWDVSVSSSNRNAAGQHEVSVNVNVSM